MLFNALECSAIVLGKLTVLKPFLLTVFSVSGGFIRM